ncbi:hypothetical protein KQR57_20845 [Bacillus inaquosorum]|nr:hypothetical protein [Bacillus inaquosorum]
MYINEDDRQYGFNYRGSAGIGLELAKRSLEFGNEVVICGRAKRGFQKRSGGSQTSIQSNVMLQTVRAGRIV